MSCFPAQLARTPCRECQRECQQGGDALENTVFRLSAPDAFDEDPAGPSLPRAAGAFDGEQYVGQWRGSLRHGQGRLVGRDGSVFEGSFLEGEFSGQGVLRSLHGHRYEGQWLHGKRHGQGVYVHTSGAYFEGCWRDGLKEGQGVAHYADGSVYTGEYAQGLKHGDGRYEYASRGLSYSGQFHADALHGEGTCTFSDGRVYAGQWRDGHMSGAGRMTWASGNRYEGQYEQDLKHGSGRFEWPDGRVYMGTWHRGDVAGPGQVRRPDDSGGLYMGTWHHGDEAAGPSRAHCPDDPGAAAAAGLLHYDRAAAGWRPGALSPPPAALSLPPAALPPLPEDTIEFTITRDHGGAAGYTVHLHSSSVRISSVEPDGPAYRAGMQEGHMFWIVTHVDGLEVTAENCSVALDATKGPGRTFTIRVKRPEKEPCLGKRHSTMTASDLSISKQIFGNTESQEWAKETDQVVRGAQIIADMHFFMNENLRDFMKKLCPLLAKNQSCAGMSRYDLGAPAPSTQWGQEDVKLGLFRCVMGWIVPALLPAVCARVMMNWPLGIHVFSDGGTSQVIVGNCYVNGTKVMMHKKQVLIETFLSNPKQSMILVPVVMLLIIIIGNGPKFVKTLGKNGRVLFHKIEFHIKMPLTAKLRNTRLISNKVFESIVNAYYAIVLSIVAVSVQKIDVTGLLVAYAIGETYLLAAEHMIGFAQDSAGALVVQAYGTSLTLANSSFWLRLDGHQSPVLCVSSQEVMDVYNHGPLKKWSSDKLQEKLKKKDLATCVTNIEEAKKWTYGHTRIVKEAIVLDLNMRVNLENSTWDWLS